MLKGTDLKPQHFKEKIHMHLKNQGKTGCKIDYTVGVMLDVDWKSYPCYTPVRNMVRFISSIKQRLIS